MRFARPVPYELHVDETVDLGKGKVTLTFSNTGKSTAVFQVRSSNILTGPWTYTVGPHKSVSDSWDLTAAKLTGYDLSVYGPNGFFREFKGSLLGKKTSLKVVPTISRRLKPSRSRSPTRARRRPSAITNIYTGDVVGTSVLPGKSFTELFHLKSLYGWYDLVVRSPATVASCSTSPAISKPARTAPPTPPWVAWAGRPDRRIASVPDRGAPKGRPSSFVSGCWRCLRARRTGRGRR